MPVSILIADDHEIFRQGLQMLLSAQPDFEVVAQAADGLETIEMAEKLHPDVVILDMLMPGLNGMDVTRQIIQRLPDSKVIILSMHDDESYVLSALQYGASGYVLKDSSTADLARSVRTAMSGQFFLSPSLAERAIQVYIKQTRQLRKDLYEALTNREREVLKLSAEGLNGPQIAERLVISVRTVETHRANMMHKLGIRSQTELVEYAREHKIITSDQVD
jgi:two-component system, NarL family, response regulator NreC